MKPTKQAIDTFLAGKKIAIAGVSRNAKKFGYQAYLDMKSKGFEVYAVNPNTDVIDGQPCHRSLATLPPEVKHLLVVTPKPETLGVVQNAIGKGMDNIWIQQMSETPEAIEFAKGHPVNLVTNACILMHCSPVKGVHKFHRGLMKLFRLLPS